MLQNIRIHVIFPFNKFRGKHEDQEARSKFAIAIE